MRRKLHDTARTATQLADALAMSIEEFCRSISISVDMFHKLQRLGQAPRVMRVGKRVLISADAAKEWIAEREQAEQTKRAEALGLAKVHSR